MAQWSAVLVALAFAAAAAGATVPVGHLGVDVAGHLARNDLVYLGPARQGWQGLPLGNGRLGAQAWQPDGLAFQLNTPLSGVYGGAIARLHLTSQPGMLAGLRSYTQRLSLHEATLTTTCRQEGGTVEVTAYIAADRDVLVLDVTDDRPGAVHRIELETWRKTAALRPESGGAILLTDRLSCGGEPDYRFALSVVPVFLEDDPVRTTRKGDNALEIAGRHYQLFVAFAGTRDPKANVAAAATPSRDLFKGTAELRKRHLEWWHRFWAQSLLRLGSDDGVADYLENLWHIHQYAMAAGSRGQVPPKFNGGLWTDNRDEREWGTSFWHWNEQEAYWPLFAANHLELHQPYQRMYFGMLPAVREWTKEMYGLDGAQFQETIPFHGRMPHWPTVRGVHPRVPVPATFAHTNAIFSSSAEIAMQFWWVWLYTGDEAFLRERALPLMKQAALFYLGYLEKDGQGRYVMWPSNAHESFWRVKNPATDLAAIRYLLGVLATASPELRDRCRDALDHLAPYPADPKTGALLPYEMQPGEKLDVRNAENPELFPIGVFPLLTLGSPDYPRALKTFRARRNVNTYGWNTDSICAARLGIADDADSRRLFPGWTPKDPRGWGIERLLPDHAARYQVYPCGLMDYYPRDPGKHCYLEGSGTFATACGEMLLQSWDGVIRVAPALPSAWSARFTLLAMGGFLVTAEAENGKVLYVAIASQRGGTCRIVNPFGEPALVRTAKGAPVAASGDATLEFPTERGGSYLVVPRSRPDAASGRSAVTGTRNDAPKALPPAGKRHLGLPAPPALGHKPAEANPPKPPAVPDRLPAAPAAPIVPARAAAPPKIDGQLDDAVWRTANPIGHFALTSSGTPATQPTEVRLACDGQALYIAVTAWESRMESQIADPPRRRDLPVEHSDSISLLIRPLDGASVTWRLAVGPLGAVYDALCSGTSRTVAANPKWTAAARRSSNRWTLEAALPYTSLAPDLPTPGTAWGLRVERREMPHDERSAFPPGPDAFATVRLREGTPSARPEAVEAGLVGYWPGEIASGVWVREHSGNGLHGLVVGAVKEADGRTGKGLDLRGGYVEVPHCARLNLTNGLTLMAWVKPARVAGSRLIDKAPAGTDRAFLFDTHPANHLRFITRFGGLGTKEAIPVGQWTHVAATFDGMARRLYINGQLAAQATATKPGTLDTTDLPLRFGADSDGGSRFAGTLDEIRIYSRPLSPAELRRFAHPEAK